MKIRHPAVTSDVFKLVTTLEFDLTVGEHFLPTRVELFQNTEQDNHFRCRMWERDLFHIKPTLAGRGEEQSSEDAIDEELMVERTWELSGSFEDFEASDPESAMQLFIQSLEDYLKRVAQ